MSREDKLDEQYDKKAAAYDTYRWNAPGGASIDKELEGVEGMKVLDLGCGTGSFFDSILSKKPKSLDACDPSQGMIDKAQERINDAVAEERWRGVVPKCWAGFTDHVQDNTYDCITCLQVLQNLVDDPSKAQAARIGFMEEIKRMLKPGGRAILTTRYRPPEGSYTTMYWYADKEVVPEAVAHMEAMVPARPDLEMATAGFEDTSATNAPGDTMIQTAAYMNGALVKDPAFRAADSFFSRVSEPEMKILLDNIEKLKADGKLDDYINERNALRGSLGHVSVVVGRKPA